MEWKMFSCLVFTLGSIVLVHCVTADYYERRTMYRSNSYNQQAVRNLISKHRSQLARANNTLRQNDAEDGSETKQASTNTPCAGTTRKWRRRKTSTTTAPSSEADIAYQTFFGHEHGIAKLKCNATKNHKIRIIGAYYGPRDISKCPPTKFGPVTHKAGDRNDAIRSLCGDWTQSQCSFVIESSHLGDGCEGVPKILRITYYCSPTSFLGL